jgi:hypothetical protein
MRGYLINKNLGLYYLLRKRIGKEKALRIATRLETVILLLGRKRFVFPKSTRVHLCDCNRPSVNLINKGPTRSK